VPAALPAYIEDFADAAPGHHFGLYYAGWNDDFSKPKSGAYRLLTDTACKLPKDGRNLLAALDSRQRSAAESLAGQLFTYPAIASAPFATGLGNEHPLENGFSFLSPYGLPYLPGSGVKGVIRKAAEELMSGEWSEPEGWSEAAIRALLGPGEDDDRRDSDPEQGALRFWDVFPMPPASARGDIALLAVEIMTPHHSGYYQNGKAPNTSEAPNPIAFLAVASDSRFTFHVECDPARLTPDLRRDWQTLVEAAFAHACQWLGFGAKTAVGYGRMRLDPDEAKRREQAMAGEIARQEKETEQQRVAQLPLDQRLLAALDAQLGKLPSDPRNGNPLLQPTSIGAWNEALSLLENAAPSIAGLDKASRETLASEIRKRLSARFKVEGKAEKTMKAHLATLRGQ